MCAAPGRVYVRVGPPAPKHVVVVHKTRPHKDAIWVSGHWNWNGHKYVWVDGHWLAPRHGYTWVPGHWQQNRHGWFWVDGHWKRV
ncbi:YXWGXW repeat-containing protein [candidate division KSB1 bacterium]|nr:YXWGXW repeat-containing protein [candidate division KSB1 bacterium]